MTNAVAWSKSFCSCGWLKPCTRWAFTTIYKFIVSWGNESRIYNEKTTVPAEEPEAWKTGIGQLTISHSQHTSFLSKGKQNKLNFFWVTIIQICDLDLPHHIRFPDSFPVCYTKLCGCLKNGLVMALGCLPFLWFFCTSTNHSTRAWNGCRFRSNFHGCWFEHRGTP